MINLKFNFGFMQMETTISSACAEIKILLAMSTLVYKFNFG